MVRMNKTVTGGKVMKHWLLGAALVAVWQGFAAAPELTAVADPLESYYPVQGRIAGTPKIHLNLFHREFGLAALSLYNPTQTTMYCRITASGFAGLKVTLREAVHIRARLGQLPADVLPELSKDGVVAVPPGENRQIFLEFDTRNGKAGTCRGLVTAVNLKDNSVVSREISLDVIAQSLPSRHPLQVMTWDCSLRRSSGKERDNLLAELQDHYVNNFHVLEMAPWKADAEGNLVGIPDFSKLDPMLKFLKGKGMLLLRCAAPNTKNAPDIRSAAGAKAYGNFVKALAAHMKEMGFDYSEYALYPLDENTGDVFHAHAKAAKAADPKILIYADPVKSKEEIKRLTVDGKYCEYMQFNAGFLRRQEVMEMARPHLKFISAYWCPVIQKRLRPNWYRNMGHVAWRLNLNGIGYWTSLWMPGSDRWGVPWDDFRGKTASAVTVYPARHNENVPSRRWKAFRAGLEDWLVFDLVRRKGNGALLKKIDEALDPKKGSAEKVKRVRAESVEFLRKGN